MRRISALLGKELADLRQNGAVFLPAILTGVISMSLPFFVAIFVPAFTESACRIRATWRLRSSFIGLSPASPLSARGRIQAWIFQQFLVLLVLTPVAGSMSVAAYSVIGEKQARTLEPLLATPLTTVELLIAKVLGALLPALALTVACFAVYVAGVALLAEPGVFRALLTRPSLTIVFILGPLAALAARSWPYARPRG